MNLELKRFENRDLQKDLAGLSKFLQDLKALAPAPEQICFVIQRNGFIYKIAKELLDACQSLPSSTKDRINQPFLLFLFYPRGIQQIPPRFLRVLWKFKIDGLVVFSPEEPDKLLLIHLKIENYRWKQELELVDLTPPEFRRLYQDEWFKSRTDQLDLEDTEEDKSIHPKCVCLSLEFTTRSLDIPTSPTDEFHSLAKTLGFEIEVDISQKLSRPQTGTFLGRGKFEEILSIVEMDDFTHLLINCDVPADRKSTRLNSSHSQQSRMPSSA